MFSYFSAIFQTYFNVCSSFPTFICFFNVFMNRFFFTLFSIHFIYTFFSLTPFCLSLFPPYLSLSPSLSLSPLSLSQRAISFSPVGELKEANEKNEKNAKNVSFRRFFQISCFQSVKLAATYPFAELKSRQI